MGSRYLTYIYDKNVDNQMDNVICKIYLEDNCDEYGYELASFFRRIRRMRDKEINMEVLSSNLVSYFFEKNRNGIVRNIVLISPNVGNCYYGQEWEYHIYDDKVRILSMDDSNFEFVSDWRTEDFADILKLIF